MQIDIVSTVEQLVVETLLEDGFGEDEAQIHAINIADKVVWMFGGELTYVKKNNEVRKSIIERNDRIIKEWYANKNCRELSRKYGLSQAIIYGIVREKDPTQDLFETHCPDETEQQQQEKKKYMVLMDEFNLLKRQLKTLVMRICNGDLDSDKVVDALNKCEPVTKKIAELQKQITN